MPVFQVNQAAGTTGRSELSFPVKFHLEFLSFEFRHHRVRRAPSDRSPIKVFSRTDCRKSFEHSPL